MSGSSRVRLFTVAQLIAERRDGALILDTRPAEEFAALHIRGSVQIGLGGPFASWAAMLLNPQHRLALVAENEQYADEARLRLARVGLERVIGYSLADEARWRRQGIELASIASLRCDNVRQTVERDRSVQLVDVRSRAEWLKGHLPGAISIPLLDIDSQAALIDPSKSSLVYCQEGFRATTAASILLRGSSADIGILIDGVEGWSALGLPLEVPDVA